MYPHFYLPFPPWCHGRARECYTCGSYNIHDHPAPAMYNGWFQTFQTKEPRALFEDFIAAIQDEDSTKIRKACTAFLDSLKGRKEEGLALVLCEMYEDRSKHLLPTLAILGMYVGPCTAPFGDLHEQVMRGSWLNTPDKASVYFEDPLVDSVLQGVAKSKGYGVKRVDPLLNMCPSSEQGVVVTGCLCLHFRKLMKVTAIADRLWGKPDLSPGWLGVLTSMVYRVGQKVTLVWAYRDLGDHRDKAGFWVQCAPKENPRAFWEEVVKEKVKHGVTPAVAISICTKTGNQVPEVVEILLPHILTERSLLVASDIEPLREFFALDAARTCQAFRVLSTAVVRSIYYGKASLKDFDRLLSEVTKVEEFAVCWGVMLAKSARCLPHCTLGGLLHAPWMPSVPQENIATLATYFFRKADKATCLGDALAITTRYSHLSKMCAIDELQEHAGEFTEGSLKALLEVLPSDVDLWNGAFTTTHRVLSWWVTECMEKSNTKSVSALKAQVALIIQKADDRPLGTLYLLSQYIIFAAKHKNLKPLVHDTSLVESHTSLVQRVPPELWAELAEGMRQSLTPVMREMEQQLRRSDLPKGEYQHILQELEGLQAFCNVRELSQRAEQLIIEFDRVGSGLATAISRLEWVASHAVPPLKGWIANARKSLDTLAARKDALGLCTQRLEDLCGSEELFDFLLRVFVETPTGVHSGVGKAFLLRRLRSCRQDALEGGFRTALEQTQGDLMRFLEGSLDSQSMLALFGDGLPHLNTKNEEAVLVGLVKRGRKVEDAIQQTIRYLNFHAHKDCVADVLTKVVGVPEDDEDVAAIQAGELDDANPLLQTLLQITDEVYEVFVAVLGAEELMHYVGEKPDEIAEKVERLLERTNGQGSNDELAVSLLHSFKLVLPVLLPFKRPGDLREMLRELAVGAEQVKSKKLCLGRTIGDLNTNAQRLQQVVEKEETKSKIQSSKEQLGLLLRKRCFYRVEVRSGRAVYKVVDEGGDVLCNLSGGLLEDFVQQVCFVVEGAGDSPVVQFGKVLVEIDTRVRETEKLMQVLADLGNRKYVEYRESWEIKPEILPAIPTRADLKRERERWEAEFAAALSRDSVLSLLPRQHVASLMMETTGHLAAVELRTMAVPLMGGGLAEVRDEEAFTTAPRPFQCVGDLDAAARRALRFDTTALRRPAESRAVRVIKYKRDASFGSMMASVVRRFDRVPYPFELLDCASWGATRSAVDLFIERMEGLPGGEYVVVGAHLLADDARDALSQYVHGRAEEGGGGGGNLTICTEGRAEDFPLPVHITAPLHCGAFPRKEGKVCFVTGGRGVGKSRWCQAKSTQGRVVHIYDGSMCLGALERLLEPLQETAGTDNEEEMTVWINISEYALTGKEGPLPVNMALLQLLYLRYVVSSKGVLLVPSKLSFVVEVPALRGMGADQLECVLPLAKMLGEEKKMSSDLIEELEVDERHRYLSFVFDVCSSGNRLAEAVEGQTDGPEVGLKSHYQAWTERVTDSEVREKLRGQALPWASNYLLLDNWVTTAAEMLRVVEKAPFALLAAGCGVAPLAHPLAETLVPSLLRQAAYFVKPEQVLTHGSCRKDLGMLLLTPKDGMVGSMAEVSHSMLGLSTMFQGAEATYRALESALRDKGIDVDRAEIQVAQLLTDGGEENVKVVHEVLRRLEFVVSEDILVRIMSIVERQRSGAPLIMVSESGVGKTYILKAMQEISDAMVLRDARNKVSYQIEQRVRQLSKRVREAWDNSEEPRGSLETPAGILQEIRALQELRDMTIHEDLRDELQDVMNAHPYLEWDRALRDKVRDGGVFDHHHLDMAMRPHMGKTFFKLLIRPGLTPDDLGKWLEEPIATARAVPRELRVTVFFDELNTSTCPGFLKTVVCDRLLGSTLLPKNLFFVASVNPFGEGYNVDRLPYSMEVLTQKLEPFGGETRKHYIHEALRRSAQSLWKADVALDVLVNFIDMAHGTVEGWHARGVAETSNIVSQRDIQRVKNMSASIFELSGVASGGRIDERDNLIGSVVTAVYFAYLARFDVESGEYCGLLVRLNDYLSRCGIDGDVSRRKKETVDLVVNETTVAIDKGVSLSGSLAENIFLTLVAVVSRSPKVSVGIVGKPGTGKTLSVNLLHKNMKGEGSRTPFFRKLKKLVLLTLQASASTSARQVAKVFEDARMVQESLAGSAHVLVCIDEAGLPKDETRVLKAVHEPLDLGYVACVMLSNRLLDRANQNRLNTVLCGEATLEDVSRLTCGCLGLSVQEYETVSQGDDDTLQLLHEIKGLTNAFFGVRKEWGARFHNRDYIHLCRHLARTCRPTSFGGGLDRGELLSGLEYNYGGGSQEDTERVFEIFFKSMGWERELAGLTRRTSVEVLRDSVRRQVGIDESVHLRPRNVLVVDPSPDYSNVARVVGDLGVETEIFCSNLHGDAQVNEDTRILNKIIHAMEVGGHVLLYNGHRIWGNLFDVLNQNFTVSNVKVDGEYRPQYFAKVAIGTETPECIVHESFRLSIAMSERRFRAMEKQVTWAPFISRFEVVLLPAKPEVLGGQGEVTKRVGRFAAEHVGVHNILARHHSGTIPSVVGLVLEGRLSADLPADITTPEGEAVYRCNAALLQVASPQAVLLAQGQLSHGGDYAREYFSRQEHFNLEDLLRKVRGRTPGDRCVPWFITTNDRYNANRLEGMLSKLDVDVVRVDRFERRSELVESLQQCKDRDLVLVVAKLARDIEVINLVRHLVTRQVKRTPPQRFVGVVAVESAFPTTFTEDWHVLHMDTLWCSAEVVSMMEAGCGLTGTFAPAQTSLRGHVIGFLKKRLVSCPVGEGGQGGEVEAALEFYKKTTKLERRVSILVEVIEGDPDLLSAVSSGLLVDEARVRNILLSTAERCVRGESTGPFAVALDDAVRQEMEQPVHNLLASLVGKKGLVSLVQRPGAREVRRTQIRLSKRAMSLGGGMGQHERRRATREWDFEPACLFNPWLHQNLAAYVAEHLPPETMGIERAAEELERSARAGGLLDDLEGVFEDEAVLKGYVHDALRVAFSFRSQGRDELDSKLVDLLLAEFRDRHGVHSPLQMAFVVTSLHAFPKALCEVLGYRGIVALVMRLVGVGREVLHENGPELFVWRALETLTNLDHGTPEAARTVHRICEAHAVLRTYLVDRENEYSARCNWSLWVLDTVSYICSRGMGPGEQLAVAAVCKVPQRGRGHEVCSLKNVGRLVAAIPDGAMAPDERGQLWYEMFMLWLGASSKNIVAEDATLPGYLLGEVIDEGLPCLSDRRLVVAAMRSLAHARHSVVNLPGTSLESCLVQSLEQAVQRVDLGDAGFAIPHPVGGCGHVGLEALFELLVAIGTEHGMGAKDLGEAVEAACRVHRSATIKEGTVAKVVWAASVGIFINTVPPRLVQLDLEAAAESADALATHPLFLEMGRSEEWQRGFVGCMVENAPSVEAVCSMLCRMAERNPEVFGWCAGYQGLFKGREEWAEDLVPLLPDEVFDHSPEGLFSEMRQVLATREWGGIEAAAGRHGKAAVGGALLHVAFVEYFEKNRCGDLQATGVGEHLRRSNPLGWGETQFRLLAFLASPDTTVQRLAGALGVEQRGYSALGLDCFSPEHQLGEEVWFRRDLLLFAVHMVASMNGEQHTHHFHQLITDPTQVKKRNTYAFGDMLFDGPIIHGWDCGSSRGGAHGNAVYGHGQRCASYCYIYMAVVLNALLHPEHLAEWPETVVSEYGSNSDGVLEVLGDTPCRQQQRAKVFVYAMTAAKEHWSLVDQHITGVAL
eukprot:Sspe_Gene.15754::Locus_5493_Transcript_1_1_Confidence_1.000_Length_11273::g.15754::m.15754